MNLLLDRFQPGDPATIGKLFVDGSFLCYTLEDKVREVDGEDVADWKVPGRTAIPRGTYDVLIDYSPHFEKELPHIMNVPGFEGIRIHPGNTDKDTEGCVLVGLGVGGPDFVTNSVVAFKYLFSKLEDAYASGEPISITVR